MACAKKRAKFGLDRQTAIGCGRRGAGVQCQRAEAIANNETTTAEREGLNDAMRNYQIAQGKIWQTMEDDAVEEDCEGNAAVGVIGLE